MVEAKLLSSIYTELRSVCSTSGCKLSSYYRVTASFLCKKAFPSACYVFSSFFSFFLLIMWLSYCTWLNIGPYFTLLLRYLLKRLVILWFWLLFTHIYLYFISFQLVFRVVGIITGYFYFIVDICLFLYRQACRYLLIYVILFYGFIWSYQSFLFDAWSF